jgi:hypothetical protein
VGCTLDHTWHAQKGSFGSYLALTTGVLDPIWIPLGTHTTGVLGPVRQPDIGSGPSDGMRCSSTTQKMPHSSDRSVQPRNARNALALSEETRRGHASTHPTGRHDDARPCGVERNVIDGITVAYCCLHHMDEASQLEPPPCLFAAQPARVG